MSRPLRIEFPGALYHLTSRGDRREAIYVDDEDRLAFLQRLGQACERFEAKLLAYCLMGNHYHLVLCTPAGGLSRFMRHLNGVYTQDFNHRHHLVGHLFQGRFKAILVDREAYLLALLRYVELNPVRARIVDSAAAWPWSSYLALTGAEPAPDWLLVREVHEALLQRPSLGPGDHAEAARRYADWVNAGDAAEATGSFWPQHLRQQIYLGDEAFVARMQALADAPRLRASEVTPSQRQAPGLRRSLQDWLLACEGRRGEALRQAYRQSGWTMRELAAQIGLSAARVGQLIRAAEREAQAGAGQDRAR